MRTRTLIALAAVTFIAGQLLMTGYYPVAVPVLGSDGLPMHGADGKILVHRDMASFYRAMIPSWILLACSAAFIIWLLVRFFAFIYGRKNHRTVA